jgi:hypothetical protein
MSVTLYELMSVTPCELLRSDSWSEMAPAPTQGIPSGCPECRAPLRDLRKEASGQERLSELQKRADAPEDEWLTREEFRRKWGLQ